MTAASLSVEVSDTVAAFLVDRDGRIVDATNAAAALCDRAAIASEVAQLPPAIGDGLDDGIARALSTNVTIEKLLGLGGRAVRLRIVPRGRAHALVFVDDVDELVADERRRAQSKQDDVFAAVAEVVAHRVGNPLAGFSAAVQLTSASLAAGDPKRDRLERALDEVKRLASVCADLLAFADAGTPARAPIDLRAVVEAAAARCPAPAGATVVIHGSGGAFGDAELLVRAVRHMLMNAWEAGAKRVVVVVSAGAARVEDDGPGLADEASERVFDPFFTTKVTGTGLGLAIARRGVSAMGGTITAGRSALGGASFDVRLDV